MLRSRCRRRRAGHPAGGETLTQTRHGFRVSSTDGWSEKSRRPSSGLVTVAPSPRRREFTTGVSAPHRWCPPRLSSGRWADEQDVVLFWRSAQPAAKFSSPAGRSSRQWCSGRVKRRPPKPLPGILPPCAGEHGHGAFRELRPPSTKICPVFPGLHHVAVVNNLLTHRRRRARCSSAFNSWHHGTVNAARAA